MVSIQAITLLLLQLLLIASTSKAFIPSPCQSKHQSQLNVGISFDEDDLNKNPSSHYLHLFQRANDCAKSEECSLEEWESVMTEMEYIADIESEELSHLVEGVHRLEERSALSTWTKSDSLPIGVLMFLASTMSMLQQDEIVVRVGWFLQDWNQVAADSTSWSSSTQLPLFLCAAAAYVAVSEVASCFLPQNE